MKLKAENGTEQTKLEGWLDAVLEELATPQKRPFADMGQPTEPKPPPELAAIEPPVEETPVVEATPAETPPVETPRPRPRRLHRRRRNVAASSASDPVGQSASGLGPCPPAYM